VLFADEPGLPSLRDGRVVGEPLVDLAAVGRVIAGLASLVLAAAQPRLAAPGTGIILGTKVSVPFKLSKAGWSAW